MDIRALKAYIFENHHVEHILHDIQCHHIKYHPSGEYWTMANRTGDNTSAVTVKNCEQLWVTNYTRQMTKTSRTNDLLDLVAYTLDLDFSHAVQYVCNQAGLSYYHDFAEDVPESFRILDMIHGMSSESNEEADRPLKPIPECILTYYKPYVNDFFYRDNISYATQKLFEVGYDEYTNRISIPIRSNIGDLVGVKGRLFKEDLDDGDKKYMYIEPCNRSRVLYGLYLTSRYISSAGVVYVVESEKGVQQLYSYGDKNCVGIGGKRVSDAQIEMIFRLGAEIVLAFDKDVPMTELEDLTDRFPDGTPIYCIHDDDNILDSKESPMDDPVKWHRLKSQHKYKLR